MVTQENILWNYFEMGPLAQEEILLKAFFFYFSSGGHFVQWSGIILAAEGHPRNISVKLLWNKATGLGGDV